MVLKKLQLHPPSLLHHYVFFPHIVVKRKREKRKSYIGYDIIHRELQLILSSGVCHILKEKLEIQVVVVVFYLQWHIHIFQCRRSADLCVPTVDRLHSDQPEW